MNFNNYKFHASGIGNLMVLPRSKKDKENNKLSDTSKKYLHDIYIKEVYGRDYNFQNKYTIKGTLSEEQSISLLTRVTNKLYTKNEKNISNDYVTGTPDIITKNTVIDIKTKWDLQTFINETGDKKMYYYQLQAYMWLTNLKKSQLAFTLVNTPQFLVVSEKNKVFHTSYYEDGSKELVQAENQVDKNHNFDDILDSKKIKIYDFEYSNEVIEVMKRQIKTARNYLNNLLD